MPIQQPNRSIPPTSQHANRYTSLSSLQVEIRSLVAQRKRVFAYQWVLYVRTKGTRPCSRLRLLGRGTILRVKRGRSNMHSVRETIDFRARAPRRKIWVIRANLVWKVVFGMFVGIVTVASQGMKARGKSIPGVKRGCTFEHSSDFMSNRGQECHQLVCVYMGVCMCFPDSPVIGWPPENLIVRSPITPR